MRLFGRISIASLLLAVASAAFAAHHEEGGSAGAPFDIDAARARPNGAARPTGHATAGGTRARSSNSSASSRE